LLCRPADFVIRNANAMILIWGVASDPPVSSVLGCLLDAGVEVALLDQTRTLETEIELTIRGDVDGILRVGDEWIELGKVTACYVRTSSFEDLPFLKNCKDRRSAEWRYCVEVHDAVSSWIELSPALVVNRPGAMANVSSKPFQLKTIRKAGFRVPDTLIT